MFTVKIDAHCFESLPHERSGPDSERSWNWNTNTGDLHSGFTQGSETQRLGGATSLVLYSKGKQLGSRVPWGGHLWSWEAGGVSPGSDWDLESLLEEAQLEVVSCWGCWGSWDPSAASLGQRMLK